MNWRAREYQKNLRPFLLVEKYELKKLEKCGEDLKIEKY